jgi:hypothetical protein
MSNDTELFKCPAGNNMKENYYSCVVSYAELSKKMEILSR